MTAHVSAAPMPTSALPVPNFGHNGFVGFAAAAGAALRQLSHQMPGMDLWLVSCVVGDRQLVVASSGRWADLAPSGREFSWQASFCSRMLAGQGSAVAPSFADEPAYRQAAVGPLAKVRAYLGVPLTLGGGELFGTLCALSGNAQPERMRDAMPLVSLVGRMLSTVLAGERAAHDRSAEAAHAYALAERDQLTGLRNRRGFESAVLTEHGRGQRFGTRSSVLAVALDARPETAESDPLLRCAELLDTFCLPGDVAARVGGDRFCLLAVQADAINARALTIRLRQALRAAHLPAAVGAATRQLGEDLNRTWERAEQAMRAQQLRRTLANP